MQLGPPGDYRGLKVAYEFAPLLGAVGPPGTSEAGNHCMYRHFPAPGVPGTPTAPRRGASALPFPGSRLVQPR